MLSQLEMDFAQIKYRWRIHSELFDEDEKVDILNNCGGQVFGIFQGLLVYDTLAAICRLCDPPKSKGSKNGQENNSIYNQYEKRKGSLSSANIQEIDIYLSALRDGIKNIKTLRDKSMSHNDLGVAEKTIKLPDVTFGEIDNALNLITKILNKMFNVSGNYESVTAFGPGVSKLFKVLNAGVGR